MHAARKNTRKGRPTAAPLVQRRQRRIEERRGSVSDVVQSSKLRRQVQSGQTLRRTLNSDSSRVTYLRYLHRTSRPSPVRRSNVGSRVNATTFVAYLYRGATLDAVHGQALTERVRVKFVLGWHVPIVRYTRGRRTFRLFSKRNVKRC